MEKEFGKLRQGSGGAYFLSVQQVVEKLNIKKTTDLDHGHACYKCQYELSDAAL